MKTTTRKLLLLLAAALLGAPNASRAGTTCTWLCALEYHSDATLVEGTNGKFYGTTVGEVVDPLLVYYGNVFEAYSNVVREPLSEFPFVVSNLALFNSTTGGQPNAGVILGPTGSLFGTTAFYATSNTLFPTGMGSVFTVTPTANGLGEYPYTRLYHFGSVTNSHGQPLDGASPRAALAYGPGNYLYGTTCEGGSNGYSGSGLGYGTVFKLTTNGSTFTELHSFTGADGANPTGLTFGADSNLYGVASFGGSNSTVVETNGKTGFGTIFKITTNGALTVLYSFGTLTNAAGNALDGSQPNRLLLGTDGNFYGTAAYGGSNTTVVDSSNDVGYGTFYRISTNGAFAALYSFGAVTNSAGVPLDGANPSGPLVQGLDGNFYGATQFGGPTNTGTIFRMTPQGTLTTLYSFGTNSAHYGLPPLPPVVQTGMYPRGGLMIGADGNFYGTTYTGGPDGDDKGAIFRLGPAVPDFSNAPPNLTVPAGATNVYSAEVNSIYLTSCQWQFDGTNLADGGNISGSATSNLTLSAVTLADSGTYTLVASNVAGASSVSAILTVVPAVIRQQPAGATIIAGATNTFSVGVNSILSPAFQWQFDGASLSDGGTISGSATSTLTVSGAALADSGTYSVIISNAAGTVQSAGATLVVEPFMVTIRPASVTVIAGTPASFTMVAQSVEPMNYQWQFDGANLSDNGHIVGSATTNLTVNNTSLADAGTYAVVAANAAGSANYSALLNVLVPVASGCALNNLYSFTDFSDGANPAAALLQATDGNLYGTASSGGAYGGGTVFCVSNNGAFSVLYPFGLQPSDGFDPLAALVEGVDGNFYGTTENGGGTNGQGTVFVLTPDGDLTNLLVLGAGAGDFQNALTPDGNGTFYVITGDDGFYQITSAGVDTLITNAIPYASLSPTLLLGSNGNFYTVASYGGNTDHGCILEITTNGGWTELYSFTGGADGADPEAPLAQGADGTLYGTTSGGGAHGFGTVFSLATNGTLSVLYSFGTVTNSNSSALDDTQPNGLLLGNDGNFYGTTAAGGFNVNGTVFRLTPGGQLTTLVYFDGTNGANPEAALIQANDGNYYGTTVYGGSNNFGTVFQLSVPPGLTAAGQTNGMVSFSCSAVVGQTYQLQYTSCLAPALWQNLGGPIQAATPLLTFTDAIAASQRFYRVVLLPAQ